MDEVQGRRGGARQQGQRLGEGKWHGQGPLQRGGANGPSGKKGQLSSAALKHMQQQQQRLQQQMAKQAQAHEVI